MDVCTYLPGMAYILKEQSWRRNANDNYTNRSSNICIIVSSEKYNQLSDSIMMVPIRLDETDGYARFMIEFQTNGETDTGIVCVDHLFRCPKSRLSKYMFSVNSAVINKIRSISQEMMFGEPLYRESEAIGNILKKELTNICTKLLDSDDNSPVQESNQTRVYVEQPAKIISANTLLDEDQRMYNKVMRGFTGSKTADIETVKYGASVCTLNMVDIFDEAADNKNIQAAEHVDKISKYDRARIVTKDRDEFLADYKTLSRDQIMTKYKITSVNDLYYIAATCKRKAAEDGILVGDLDRRHKR